MEQKYKIIQKNHSFRYGIEAMNKNSTGTLFIVENEKIIGIFSEGDFRKAILREINLDTPIKYVMNKKFKFIGENVKEKKINKIFKKIKNLKYLPVLGKNKKIIKILERDEFIKKNKKISNNECVIMAGGLGSRLDFFTKIFPKALVPIGNKPIIEKIIEKFRLNNIGIFYCVLNHKANLIKSYLKEIQKNNKIFTVKEQKPLGTVGGLILLKDKLKKDFFLTNCDVTLDIDYQEVLNYHKKSKNIITIVAVLEKIKFPYGVFTSNSKGKVLSLKEKPEINNLINSGFYVLSPKIMKFIPKNTKLEMNELIKKLIKKNKKVSLFPVHPETWKDFGNLISFEKNSNIK